MSNKINFTPCLNRMVFIFTIFILVLLPRTIYSEPYFHLDYVGLEQGLEDSSVERILQDSDGYIWFGTHDGLYKYDGRKATKYSDDGKDGSLISDDVNDMLLSKNNSLWVATNTSGVAIYNDTSDSFFHITDKSYPSKLSHYKVSKIADFEHKVWVLTESGIDSINIEDYVVSRTPFKNPKGEIQHNFKAKSLIVFDRMLLTLIENNIYVLNNKENIFEPFQLKNYKKNSYSSSDEHFGLYAYDAKNFFVYTSKGLHRVNSNTETIYREPINISEKKTERVLIQEILVDNYQTTWVTTLGHGIYYRLANQSTYKVISVGAGKHQLNTDQVFSIFQDLTNNIWIGTDGYYSAKFRTPQYVFPFYTNFYLKNRSDHTNTIWTFEEFMGNLYLGSDNGVFLITKSDANIKPFITSEKYRQTYDLLTTSKEMYIGGLNGLNSLLPSGETRNHNHLIRNALKQGLDFDFTVTQLAQSDTYLFVGTFNGLIAIEKNSKNTTYYNHKNGDYQIDNGAIMSLEYDSTENLLWIGSETGVEVISTSFDKKADMVSKILEEINGYVNDIHIDKQGHVWIAVDSILYRFTPEFALLKYEHFPESEVRAIETVGNTLWMTTPKGMLKVSIDNLEDFVYYIQEDGLYNTANTTMSSAYLKSSDELLFGGDKGFVKFKSTINIPIKDAIAPRMNNILLTNAQGQPNILERLKTDGSLEYFENSLRFEFAHLDFKAPKKTKFQYILEGFDVAWSSLSNENNATYTNLKSGNYVFRVKVFDANNVLSSKELSINFLIKSAWWKSDFAYFLYFIATLFGVLLMISGYKSEQARIKNLQIQKNKEEFISGYNRYALSLTELQSHQTLVRKFLDQVKLITGVEYLHYNQFLQESKLDIELGVLRLEDDSVSEIELTAKNTIAHLSLQNSSALKISAMTADIQILFQQMVILQNALMDKQRYNWNDYFSSLTGLHNVNSFKSIMRDEIERSEINNLSMVFYEWNIDKSQFKDNELLKRIQLLSYGDKIKDVFGAHVIATFSENFDDIGKFIIFLSDENYEKVQKYKVEFESVINEMVSSNSDANLSNEDLVLVRLQDDFSNYIAGL